MLPFEITRLRVVPARERDRATVANLIQLYLHDMAEYLNFPVSEDGRYAYDMLDAFWDAPYLLYGSQRPAGFALVARETPLGGDADWHMAEFCVLRPYRRRGEISTWMHDITSLENVQARFRADKRCASESHRHGFADESAPRGGAGLCDSSSCP